MLSLTWNITEVRRVSAPDSPQVANVTHITATCDRLRFPHAPAPGTL